MGGSTGSRQEAEIRELQRLGEEQAALRRVATLVAQGASPGRLFAVVAEQVAGLLGVPLVSIARFEADGTATECASRSEQGELFRVGRRWSLDGTNVLATLRASGRASRINDYTRLKGEIAETVREVGIRSTVGVPIVVAGRLWGAIVVSSPELEPLAAETESRLMDFSELVAMAISNASARAEVERLAQEQAALRRVATMVARAHPAEEIFSTVAEEVGLFLGVDAVVIHRYEPEGDATVVASWGKLGDTFRVGSRSRLDGDDVTALVYRTGQPVRLDDYATATGSIAAKSRRLGVRAAVGSAIFVNGRLWGVLGAATSAAEPMPADTESRLAQFTELMATAISNVQTRSDLAASRARIVAAADEERRRVVRDLHDGAQQRLVHTIVTLKLARRAFERGQGDADALLGQALQHAQTANDELRELARGILPSILTHGGLGAGVRALASRMSIPIEIDVSVERLPAAVEATAYFIVAEALTNVAKHSQARSARVIARVQERRLQVEVSDDGVGGAQPDGPGLVGLRDRVAVLNGSLRIASKARGGTVIAASIPALAEGQQPATRRAESRLVEKLFAE